MMSTQQSFTLTDEEKKSLVETLISEWENMRVSFTKEELDGNSGIDVRLQFLNDELSLHTGDIQYDPSHLGYWGYGFLDYDWDGDELEAITNLVNSLVEQIEEAMSMY